MAKYQGHRSWNAWNVSLWINNDEVLYNLARECVRKERNRNDAARAFLHLLPDYYGSSTSQAAFTTPDGAPYTVTSIREAMRGM